MGVNTRRYPLVHGFKLFLKVYQCCNCRQAGMKYNYHYLIHEDGTYIQWQTTYNIGLPYHIKFPMGLNYFGSVFRVLQYLVLFKDSFQYWPVWGLKCCLYLVGRTVHTLRQWYVTLIASLK